MDNVILNSYSKISYLNVSRETCNELESLISMIQQIVLILTNPSFSFFPSNETDSAFSEMNDPPPKPCN